MKRVHSIFKKYHEIIIGKKRKIEFEIYKKTQGEIVIPSIEKGILSDDIEIIAENEEKIIKVQHFIHDYLNKIVGPNYFLCLRINDENIQNKVKEIQNSISLKFPNLKKYMIQINKLHLTLFVLKIYNQDAINQTKQILNNSQTIIRKYFSCPPILTLKGLSHFNQRVLFVDIEDNEESQKLKQFTRNLYEEFTKNTLFCQSHYQFTPHMTIMKIRNNNHKFRKSNNNNININNNQFEVSLLEPFKNILFGWQLIPNLELVMMDEHGEDNFYKSIYSIPFSSFSLNNHYNTQEDISNTK
jgi:2'-5' RNA ligase